MPAREPTPSKAKRKMKAASPLASASAPVAKPARRSRKSSAAPVPAAATPAQPAPGRTRRTILGEGKYLRLVSDDGWEYAERRNVTGVVAIVARTPRGRLLLVEQFRPAIGGRVIELPAGLVGDTPEFAGEEMAQAVLRELREETGYEARKLTFLAHGASSAGLTPEIVTFYRATGLKKVAAGGGDGSESIIVHEVPLTGIRQWLLDRTAEGYTIDAKIYAGLYFVGTPQPLMV